MFFFNKKRKKRNEIVSLASKITKTRGQKVYRKCFCQVNFHGLKAVAFSGTGYACPTSSDTSIYGLKTVVLRRKSKTG
jgi:hypothetical protein